MQRLFYSILFLLCVGYSHAQPYRHYTFSHLGKKAGLVSNSVRGVQQDKKGYIWIATANGLQRYDGRRLLTIRHSSTDSNSIPSDYIESFVIDKKGRLWLHLNGNRVGYMNTDNLSFHEVKINADPDLVKKQLAGLYKDRDDNIILLIARRMILTYNESNDEFSEENNLFTLPDKWRPQWVYQDDQQKNYWIGCDSGLAKYNPHSKKLSYRGHNIEKDEIIAALGEFRGVNTPCFDHSGRFWISSWTDKDGGPFLFSYDTRSKQRTDWGTFHRQVRMMYHEIRNIQEMEDGTVWVVGLNIMAFLSPGSNKWQQVFSNALSEFAIRYDVIISLFEDREKNIWVACDKGLYRFNPSAQLFKVYGNQRPGRDSTYTPDVTDILQLNDGNILVSTWGNGTFAYNRQLDPLIIPYIKTPSLPGEALMWAMIQRKNGDIWRACQGGFILITSAVTKKTESIRPEVFQTSTIRQLAEDKNGNIWFGSHGGHVVKWDAASNTFSLILKASEVDRIYCDSKGYVWACTTGDGLYCIDASTEKVIAHYTSNAPTGKRLWGAGAFDIAQYNDSIYIVSSECINILDIKNGTIRFFSKENGLPSSLIENILVDKKGYIWATTDNDLCRVKIETGATSIFTEEDGLPASAYNVASINMLKDGRIAVGRVHDFIVFDPEHITPDAIQLPKPEITAFAVMNKWLPADSIKKLKDVVLNYNKNSVTIEFSTLTYQNHFAVLYMMKNLDKDWIVDGGAQEAVYNYLPPGNYTFLLKCVNGEGGTSEIASIKISVKAPFWETWWFYSLLALTVALIFYLVDRQRMRRKEAMQKMRGEIAGNLHQEINTALNNINVLSEIARLKADKEPEQSKRYINEIHLKSHNMIIAMDDMLWSIDPANDSMAKTVNRMREFAEALCNRHNVIIEVQTGERVTRLKPDMKIRHELLLVYKMALRLLAEDYSARETMIHLYYIQSQLQLNIFSPGLKLDIANNHVIKTIEEIKERAASVDGSLEFQSDEKGTAIILAVKAM